MSKQSRRIDRIIDEALNMNLREFVQLIKNVIELFKKENGRVGNLKITGRLVEAAPKGEATVIGDIHGDMETLVQILKERDIAGKIGLGENSLLIFLGDYGDRGKMSPEVYYVVLKLKERYPKNVVLLRGNHEGPVDLLASPHDLPSYLRWKFGEDWSKAYAKLCELWNYLYNCVLVNQRYVMLHGGIPVQANSLDDLAFANEKHPQETYLEDILWSDPEENLTGTYPSPRGAGKLFGEDVTANFLSMFNVSVMIRGHEPSEQGYKINHHGKVMTIFTRKGEPYGNLQAAYLQLNLSKKIENAYQLSSSLRFL
jgi:protein phosphatase